MSHHAGTAIAPTAHHVIQRGIHRCACFYSDEDYLVFLDCLREAAERHRCAVHAYALLADRVHLLIGSDAEERLALTMRCVSGRYLEYVNYIHQHNGALWEGRREHAPIGGARDLLECCRYVESVPLRAGIVASAADYPWSSYRHHALGTHDPVIREHPAYLALGANELERRLAYRELFHGSVAGRMPVEARVAAICGFTSRAARSGEHADPLARRAHARVRATGLRWAVQHAPAAA